jgi:hypothetical protein
MKKEQIKEKKREKRNGKITAKQISSEKTPKKSRL